jgi:ABC-type multidrug transport system ATPase subunit
MSYAIECKDLTKRFGDFKALKNVNLSVDKNRILAILGHNGAGKSTLIRVLSTIMHPTEGKVFIDGKELKEDDTLLRSKIGLLSHNSYLYSNLSAKENLKFYSSLYNLKDPDKRIDEILKKVNLYDRRNDRVGTYSRGMTQRLSLARALLHQPSILLLDEPETGLDRDSMELLWEIVRTDDTERTVIFTSHNFQSTVKICDEFIIMKKGSVVHRQDNNGITESDLEKIYSEVNEGKK